MNMRVLEPFSDGDTNIECKCRNVLKEDILECTFLTSDPCSSIVWPKKEMNIGFTDDLWKKTCFELFIGAKNQDFYWEWNFSPSGNWALYKFSSYRSNMASQVSAEPPVISVKNGSKDSEVRVEVKMDGFPDKEDMIIGNSAIIEHRDGGISYWALKHMGERPDFHIRESFDYSFL